MVLLFSFVCNFLIGQSPVQLSVRNSEQVFLSNANITVNGINALWNDESRAYEVEGVKPPYTLEVTCDGYGGFFAKNIEYFGGSIRLLKEDEPYYYHGWEKFPCKDIRNALVVVLKRYDGSGNRMDDKVSFQTTDSLIKALGYKSTICPDRALGCDDTLYVKRMKSLGCFYLQKADYSVLDQHSPAFLEKVLLASGKVDFVGIPINPLLPQITPYALSRNLIVHFEPRVQSRRKVVRLLKEYMILPYGKPQKEEPMDNFVAHIQLPIDYIQGMNGRTERLMRLPEVAYVEMEENGYLIFME
jgi:hypothetical protein